MELKKKLMYIKVRNNPIYSFVCNMEGFDSDVFFFKYDDIFYLMEKYLTKELEYIYRI